MATPRPGIAAPAGGPRLLVGACRTTIDLEGVLPVEGFVTVTDPLEARVAVLDDGETRVAVGVVDLTSISTSLADELRAEIATAARLHPDHVVIVASHTFSAPHVAGGDGDRWHDAVVDAVRRSAHAAANGLHPGTLAVGRGRCDINVNRDVRTREGYWLGADDAGPSDTSVTVAVLRDSGGTVIAILAGYAVQSSVMSDSVLPGGGRSVGGDLAGAAMRHVEGRYPGAVSLFLVGAAADQAPRYTAVSAWVDSAGVRHKGDLGEAGRILVGLQGDRLGGEIVRVAEAATPSLRRPRLGVLRDDVVVAAREAPPREEIRPRLTHRWASSGEAHVPIAVVRLGDLALACLAPELTAVSGLEVVTRSPAPVTAVVTMADGAAKYLADRLSFERVTYEAMASRFAPGSAEVVTDGLVALVGRAFPARIGIKLRISKRLHDAVFNLVISIIMSLAMSFVLTAVNVGFGPFFGLAFLKSFGISVVVSFVVTYATMPLVGSWMGRVFQVEGDVSEGSRPSTAG
ncbi:MAG TPA: DUF2798 domain-containing protein [Cellulomonas sp.]